jgi:phenylalanyl-tRNA synthetase beta chain
VGTAGVTLEVQVPPTRSDVLHACDIAEDIAVAFGFNNVPEALPSAALVGHELPLNHLTELLRVDVAAAGFTEILTWALCSRAENFGQLRQTGGEAVEIGNPATQEFQVSESVLFSFDVVGPLISCVSRHFGIMIGSFLELTGDLVSL